jgi:hypothetical protein
VRTTWPALPSLLLPPSPQKAEPCPNLRTRETEMTEPLTPAPSVEGLMNLADLYFQSPKIDGGNMEPRHVNQMAARRKALQDYATRLTATQAPAEPLSDERIDAVIAGMNSRLTGFDGWGYRDLARAIEAAVRAQAPINEPSAGDFPTAVEFAEKMKFAVTGDWVVGWDACRELTLARAQAPSAAASQLDSCSLNCTTECKAELHGCASECPILAERRASSTAEPATTPAEDEMSRPVMTRALTVERLKELIRYQPLTGHFTWAVSYTHLRAHETM